MPELLLSLILLKSWTLRILYNISHWQLGILAPPLDFSAPKKLSLGGGHVPPGHHTTGYTDKSSNRSVFISLRSQIDRLWIAYSDIYVLMHVLIISVWIEGENVTILVHFQMKTHPYNRGQKLTLLDLGGSSRPPKGFSSITFDRVKILK